MVDERVSATTDLSVTTLGAFAVAWGGRAVPNAEWSRKRAAALFRALVGAPGFRLAADALIERLWPDSTPLAGRTNLRVKIFEVRAILARNAPPGVDAIAFSPLLFEGGVVAFDPRYGPRIDAFAFERAGVEALERNDDDAVLRALESYGGPYLPEERCEATLALRERFARVHRALGLRAAHVLAAAPERVERLLAPMFAAYPFDEELALALASVRAALGRRVDLRDLYLEHERALRARSGLVPAERLAALAGFRISASAAHAAVANGGIASGAGANGASANGASVNGASANGASANGASANGVSGTTRGDDSERYAVDVRASDVHGAQNDGARADDPSPSAPRVSRANRHVAGGSSAPARFEDASRDNNDNANAATDNDARITSANDTSANGNIANFNATDAPAAHDRATTDENVNANPSAAHVEERGTFVPSARRLGPLVGRASELASARAVLEAAANGGAACCSIAGVAGVGKSRFARELESLARARGFAVAFLRAFRGAPLDMLADDVLDALEATDAPPCYDDELGAIARAVAAARLVRPVLLVLDDAAFVPDALRASLAAAASAAGAHGCALVLVARDLTALDVLEIGPHVEHLPIVLGPLDAKALETIVEASFDGPVDGALLALLAGLWPGDVGLALTAAAHARASGAVSCSDGVWHLRVGCEPFEVLPERNRLAIARRVLALDAASVETIKALAFAGDRASRDTVALLTARDVATTARAFAAIEAAGLGIGVEQSLVLPQAVRAVAAQMLSRRRRSLFVERLAGKIAGSFS